MQTTRYRIQRLLARGGMGEVFEAVAVGESGFERRVALKRLTEVGVADPAMLRMFLDEAHIASKLHHAGIVAVLDFGLVDGAPFQILELVDGMSASALVRTLATQGRALPVPVALHVAREVAHALAHAHDRADSGRPLGIVHRDVKPANVLLSWEGDVKLGDFGIARAHDRSERTATGEAKGTSGYMAPEQARAEPVDGRADLFSLGATLLSLVLARNPLSDPHAQVALALHDDLSIPSEVPADVERIVRRALRRDPAARYPTARAMADALSDALAQRGAGDGRRALVDVLGSIRSPGPRAGALDALLQLDLVPDDAPLAGGTARSYTARAVERAAPGVPAAAPGPGELVGKPSGASEPTTRVTVGDRGPADATRDAAAALGPGPPAPLPATPARRYVAPVALGLLLLGGLGLAGTLGLQRWGGGRVDVPPPADAALPRTTSAPLAPVAIVDPPAAEPAATGIDEPAPPPDVSAVARARPPAPASAPPGPSASPAPAPAAPSSASAVERGVIAVGGEPTARIRVTVDGAFVGHAPLFSTVGVGSHAVQLTHPDGRSHRATVVVTAANTTRSPARVIPPF